MLIKFLFSELNKYEFEVVKTLTTVFYVRHAEPNYHNHDDAARELSSKGLNDRKLVTQFLKEKNIDIVVSSPFKRAIDTIKDFADSAGLDIELNDAFRERKVGNGWIDDFISFSQNQWHDFSYKLPGGECLKEVQERNIAALQDLIQKHKGQQIVIGEHGTALSTILNFYDSSFGYDSFEEIKGKMPLIVEFQYNDALDCCKIYQYDLL